MNPLASPNQVPEGLIDGLRGRFDIEAEIGRGGMAVVYRGFDQRHHRAVALKVLRPGLVATEMVDRFHREIRTVANLVHPHILPLYDSGEIAGDPPVLYFVMPYIVGESLREHLAKPAPVPLDRALRIAREVAAALDYAHRNGVVHRDIKPENILIHEGAALVTDFGVARLLSEDRVGSSVTAPGLALGTPAYMSPEQAGGDAMIDPRSDQYSLACVLYEMLGGEPPFVGSVRVMMAKHLTATPASLLERRSDLSPAIDQAILKALAKEPADRYASAAEFGDALMTPLAGLTPQLGFGTGSESIRMVAVLPFANAGGDPENEYLSDGITEELIAAVAQMSTLRVASRSSSFAFKGTRHDAKTVGAILGAQAILEGSVHKQGDRTRVTVQLTDTRTGSPIWAERYDRQSSDLLEVQEEIARDIVDRLRTGPLAAVAAPTRRRYVASPAGYANYLKGRFAWNKRTAKGIEEAIRHFNAALETDPKYALAVSGLADTYALGIDYRAITVAEGMTKARQLATEALALDDTLAEAHTSLAWVTFIHDWDWDRAKHHFERAIELDPRYPTARQWHSWYLAAMGRVHEAILEARLAVDLDPASPSIRRGVGWLYHFARNPAAGLDDLRRAVVMNPESSETHLLLGQCLTWIGQFDEAELALREAIILDSEDTYALSAIGRLRALQGRLADAREIRDRMTALSRHRYVSPSDFVRIHLALNEPEPALDKLEKAHQEGRGFLVYLKVEPMFDPIRTHPRFQEMLTRMRLD